MKLQNVLFFVVVLFQYLKKAKYHTTTTKVKGLMITISKQKVSVILLNDGIQDGSG